MVTGKNIRKSHSEQQKAILSGRDGGSANIEIHIQEYCTRQVR